MKKIVSLLIVFIMIFGCSTIAFAADETGTANISTSDESKGNGSLPTDFAVILILIAAGTTVASFKRRKNDRDYDEEEPYDNSEEEI